MALHDAFISYSRRDKAFAARLEQQLEKYKAPGDLPVRQGHLNIFRDEKDFTGADYFESLQQHLQDSETLIVLCSPHARASEYVNDEIRRFVDLKDADRIIPILVSGIPNNEASAERDTDKAFPEALIKALPMPLAANYLDFDVDTDRVDRGAYADAWFTVLANIYGVSRSEIEQRERKRRARFVRTAVALTASVVALLVIALIVTLLSRAEAVRQAIEARRETSTRLAVQALEKISGQPETALRLAIDAVETYHKHGDPPVSRALEALHRARLSFGGGQPVMPSQPDDTELLFSENLAWAAAASDNGEVRFTRAGSGEVVTLQPPPLLDSGETWDEASFSLLFTHGRLIAGRGILEGGKRQPREAAYWYWPISRSGIEGEAVTIARFPVSLWNRLDPVVSPGGRWLSWYGKGDTLFLKDLDSADDALQIESEYDLRAMRAFSRDETRLLAVTQRGLVVLALVHPDSGDVASMPAEIHRLTESLWKLESTLAFITFSMPERLCGGDESVPGLSRVAIVDDRGDAAWWDLSDEEPKRRPLPNIFTAFAEQMQVWRLEKRQFRASLEFSPCARRLLASVVKKDGEFGMAAHIALDEGASWKPVIVEQLKSQLHASISRTSGTGFGISEGYKLKDRKQLGVSHATWFTPEALLTVGLDGSLEFHDPEKDASQYLSGDITSVDETDYLNDEGGISAGTRSGKLKIFGEENTGPLFVLSGHDSPVERVMQSAGGRRVVTVATSGQARTWDMNNPVLRPDHYRGVADDWGSFLHGDRVGRLWRFSAEAPYLAAVEDQATPTETAYAITAQGDWVVERIGDSDDAAASTLNLRRRTAQGAAGGVAVSRELKLPFPARPDPYWHRWRWDDNGHLAVTDTQALLLVTGSDRNGSGAFLVDLYAPDEQPAKLLDPADHYAIAAVAKDMSRMLIKRYREPGQRLEVRGVLQHPGEEIFSLEGQNDGELSSDGRWLVTPEHVYDLGSREPARRTGENTEHGWRLKGVVLEPGRPPLWLDESGDLWGLDHAADARSPPLRLLAGLGLNLIAWSDDGAWLGLGGKDGQVRVTALQQGANFTEIAAALEDVARAPALPASGDEEERKRIVSLKMSTRAGWLAASTGNSRYSLWRGVPGAEWEKPIQVQYDAWRRDGEFFVDGRWLVADDGLYDFSSPTTARRALREAEYKWRYPEPVFAAGRPPLWLNESGDLWGVDQAVGAQGPPQLLVSGLDLSEISWSEDAAWLGLGSSNGDVRIAVMGDDAEFNQIKERLARVAGQPPLPAPWDKGARDSIRTINMSNRAGWVSARSGRIYWLLWRADDEGGWREPIVLQVSDGLHGSRGLECRSDGQRCFLEGQLLIFDEKELISTARALLPDG